MLWLMPHIPLFLNKNFQRQAGEPVAARTVCWSDGCGLLPRAHSHRPLSKRISPAMARNENARLRLALKRVLVVEDDAVLSMDIEATLRDAGVAEVLCARTTQQAIELLEGSPPDAIVLDVHLGDRSDGYAIAELAQMLGPKPARIVFSTGAPQDIPQAISDLGLVLEKPYPSQDLIEALGKPAHPSLLRRLRSALS